MAYTHLQLVETTVFTRQVQAVLTEASYRLLQMTLLLRPDAGALISGAAGLRKLRWAVPGRGKRSGVRLIYYWRRRHQQIVLLYLYPKNARSTLSMEELRVLRRLIDEW